MTFSQDNNSTNGAFIARENNTIAGEMTYVWAGNDKMIIDHTEVEDKFSNQGVGTNMVKMAVEFARQENIKILPLCPFAKSVFDKTPAFRDVLVD